MAISDKDKEYMEMVAAYFRSTKDAKGSEGSIRDTAVEFGINRNKVRKILITTGDITSPITENAVKLREQGLTIQAIAERLKVSTATVSTYLPYEGHIKDSLDPTPHTQAVREYRAYEREQAERQVNKKGVSSWKDEWKSERKLSYTETDYRPARKTWEEAEHEKAKMREEFISSRSQAHMDHIYGMVEEVKKREESDLAELDSLQKLTSPTDEQEKRLILLQEEYGRFPGALFSRNIKDLEAISGEHIPHDPQEVLRLHMELVGFDEEETKILKELGEVKYGDTISRDVVVPSVIPLYAIHYLIQRLFGFQNYHLHKFNLPEEKLLDITENKLGLWIRLVGIMFRSPFMSEDDEFWADDYESGSFKNWLTKKYTGPYLSQCYGEGIIACEKSMENMYLKSAANEDYYVLYIKYSEDDVRVIDMKPVYNENGEKNDPPTSLLPTGEQYWEIVKFNDAPIDGFRDSGIRSSFDLLERLAIEDVLQEEPEDISADEMVEPLMDFLRFIEERGIDSPSAQVKPEPVTDTIYYNYDFGDNWVIKITVTDECRDLVEQGRITQEQLDKAQIKCRELYRPVTLAADGVMLVEDVGGVSGFIEFLKTINPDFTNMTPDQRKIARQEKKEYLDWAKSLGWGKTNPII